MMCIYLFFSRCFVVRWLNCWYQMLQSVFFSWFGFVTTIFTSRCGDNIRNISSINPNLRLVFHTFFIEIAVIVNNIHPFMHILNLQIHLLINNLTMTFQNLTQLIVNFPNINPNNRIILRNKCILFVIVPTKCIDYLCKIECSCY